MSVWQVGWLVGCAVLWAFYLVLVIDPLWVDDDRPRAALFAASCFVVLGAAVMLLLPSAS